MSHHLSACISHYECRQPERAKDYLRAYVCSIFDLLWAYYDLKLDVFDYQTEIANEAIRNTLSPWENFNVSKRADSWVETLRTALNQHTGRTIWKPEKTDTQDSSLTGKQASAYARAAIDIASSPLLMYIEQANRTEEQPSQAGLVPPPSPESIGAQIKAYILEARLRPEDIAEEIGIQPRNVYRHLSGETLPTLSNIGKYESALSKHLKRTVKLPTPANVRTSVKRQ